MTEDARDPLIRLAVESFNDANLESLLAFIHPRVESRVAEGLGNPGTHEGIEGFGAMMADWGEAWSDQHLELKEIEHLDDKVSLVHVQQSLVGAGSGIPVERETTFLIGFEDDRAIRFEIHTNRDSAVAALEA